MLDRKLHLAWILVAASSLLASASCSTAKESTPETRGPITISATHYFKDKDLKPTIDIWNKSHPNEQVTGLFADDDNQTTLQAKWRKDFIGGKQTADIYAADDVFTSEAVSRGMVDDVTSIVDTRDLFSSMNTSGKFNGRQYGVPRGGNGGILIYRKDLVKAPSTQAQLRTNCSIVRIHVGMSCYAGQFGAYEGRTLNFTEFVYSAGGEILNSDHDLVINSNASHTGLQNMVDLFKLGIAPKESITWTESDGLQAFSNGKLLFLRSWPYMYDAVIQESLPGTVGVTALPGIPSIATINLYVSSRTKHKDTALDFMRYSIGGESQSIVYRDSRVPSQASFYNDRNLLAKDPLLATIRDSLLVAKPRASFTRYSEASALIQKEVGLALTGVQSVELTISHLNLKLVEFI